jgi:hypothetical protein
VKSTLKMLLRNSLVLAVFIGLAAAQTDFICPDEFEGYYPHDTSCDKYWECKEGVAKLELCGNGLAFDDLDPTFTTKNCDVLDNVECGQRTELEPAISAPNCPRLYGTFDDPDDCTAFYNCRDGHANRFSCAPGLAYDISTRVCNWADRVDSCKKEKEARGEDPQVFDCPDNTPVGIFTKHPHPEDCRQYFVCIAGIPREYGCPIGTVFKVSADQYEGQCTNPEEVPECQNYYGDLEFGKEELAKSGADPEAIGVDVSPQLPRVRASRPRTELPRPSSPVIAEIEQFQDDFSRAPPPPRKESVSSNSFRTRTRLPSTNNPAPPVPRANPVTTATTPRPPPPTRPSQQRPSQQRPPRVEVPALPLVSSRPAGKKQNLGQPTKVKAGEDYYYYYYYYDDDDYPAVDGAEDSAAVAVAASTA